MFVSFFKVDVSVAQSFCFQRVQKYKRVQKHFLDPSDFKNENTIAERIYGLMMTRTVQSTPWISQTYISDTMFPVCTL